ncbi:MAG: putative aldouronate transport system substrate-binding protein [Clostridiales bacterium]|nr:putative aldouronate transport system substrate-binding protein [Clostridiales bacterium]
MKLKKIGIRFFLCAGIFFLWWHQGKLETKRETTSYTKLVVAYPSMAAGTQDQKLVEEAINQIVRKKLGLEIEFEVYNADYERNVNQRLLGQEQLDIVFLYKSTFEKYMLNDQLVGLDALLLQYGGGIQSALGTKIIDTCRVNGNLYGLPNNRDYAVGWDAYMMRKDLLDKYEIDPRKIKTTKDLETVFETIKEGEPDITVVASSAGNMLSNAYFSLEPVGVHMNEGSDTKVSNLFETDEFLKAVTRIRRWYLKGYLGEHILEQTDTVENRVKQGNLFSYAYRAKPGVEQQESISCGTKMVCVQLGKNIVANNEPSFMQWSITKNTISPELSMQLLNLLYTDADIMNLLSYGVKGVHYVFTEDGHITYPEGVDTNIFAGNAWEMPNQFITYIWEGNSLSLWTYMKRFNNDAIHGCDFGFNFDSSTVSTEYTSLKEIYNQYVYILGNGLVDPREGLKKMNEEMKNNYIKEVIAEEQKQFDAWYQKQSDEK